MSLLQNSCIFTFHLRWDAAHHLFFYTAVSFKFLCVLSNPEPLSFRAADAIFSGCFFKLRLLDRNPGIRGCQGAATPFLLED